MLEPEDATLSAYDSVLMCSVSFWGATVEQIAERRWLAEQEPEVVAGYLTARKLFSESYERRLRERGARLGLAIVTHPRGRTVLVRPTVKDWDLERGTMKVRFVDAALGVAAAAIRVDGEVTLPASGELGAAQVRQLAEAMADATLRFAASSVGSP